MDMTCTCYARDDLRLGNHHSLKCKRFVGPKRKNRKRYPSERVGCLTVRFTTETFDIIQAIARGDGVTMSHVVRRLVNERLKAAEPT